MGVGASRRLGAINFSVVRDMMLTWVFTFPGCGIISYLMAKLFLAIFYEIGVGLWDFLLQAGLGIMFQSGNFIDPKDTEHLAGIWLVRLVMLGVAVFLAK